jgi:hypothetical protein
MIDIKDDLSLLVNAKLPLKLYLFRVIVRDVFNNVTHESIESIATYIFEDARAALERKFQEKNKEIMHIAVINLQIIVKHHLDQILPKHQIPLVGLMPKVSSGIDITKKDIISAVEKKATGINNYICNLKMLKDKFGNALEKNDKIKLNEIINKVELYVQSGNKKKL